MYDFNIYLQKDIEALQEASQNVSARVTTLEGECSALTGKIKPLETNLNQMNSQVKFYLYYTNLVLLSVYNP